MGADAGSERARALARRLQEAAARLVAVVETVDGDGWDAVPEPGVWSIGKEAEHVAEAAIYHQWIVRLTIGERVSSRRPAIERMKMTPDQSPGEALELLHSRTADGERLLCGLTDGQLELMTTPPRARGQRLAETIERVLIGHYDVHRASIESKLSARSARAVGRDR